MLHTPLAPNYIISTIKGAQSCFFLLKLSFLFHLKKDHFKDVNLNCSWNGQAIFGCMEIFCNFRWRCFVIQLPISHCVSVIMVIITWHVFINPNSLAPFFVSSLSPRKGRGQKMGVPPGFRTGDPPHHNALFTHGTPPGCRCPGSDFVAIWDPLLWRNGT